MTNSSLAQFVVLYRWKLKPSKEQQFIDAWSVATKALRELGSFGSRLHKGPDDIWYGYAQWPNSQARDDAFDKRKDTPEGAIMGEAILESFPEILLEPVADYLVLPR